MPGTLDKVQLIHKSFERLTGRTLVANNGDIKAAMWEAPRVILAHGTEADPLFFYGNEMALKLFEVTAEELQRMPSRLSAEAMQRDARAQLLERVARDGFIEDYAGVRISATGKRFRIEQAVVWNLLDEHGHIHGQAATFERWAALDPSPDHGLI